MTSDARWHWQDEPCQLKPQRFISQHKPLRSPVAAATIFSDEKECTCKHQVTLEEALQSPTNSLILN